MVFILMKRHVVNVCGQCLGRLFILCNEQGEGGTTLNESVSKESSLCTPHFKHISKERILYRSRGT